MDAGSASVHKEGAERQAGLGQADSAARSGCSLRISRCSQRHSSTVRMGACTAGRAHEQHAGVLVGPVRDEQRVTTRRQLAVHGPESSCRLVAGRRRQLSLERLILSLQCCHLGLQLRGVGQPPLPAAGSRQPVLDSPLQLPRRRLAAAVALLRLLPLLLLLQGEGNKQDTGEQRSQAERA